jgi:hypothetical protein
MGNMKRLGFLIFIAVQEDCVKRQATMVQKYLAIRDESQEEN